MICHMIGYQDKITFLQQIIENIKGAFNTRHITSHLSSIKIMLKMQLFKPNKITIEILTPWPVFTKQNINEICNCLKVFKEINNKNILKFSLPFTTSA